MLFYLFIVIVPLGRRTLFSMLFSFSAFGSMPDSRSCNILIAPSCKPRGQSKGPPGLLHRSTS